MFDWFQSEMDLRLKEQQQQQQQRQQQQQQQQQQTLEAKASDLQNQLAACQVKCQCGLIAAMCLVTSALLCSNRSCAAVSRRKILV